MEINYISSIEDFDELYYKCWSGAIDRLDEIRDNDLEYDFMEYLEEMLTTCYDSDNIPTLTDINDFIWFDCDEWIEEHKKGVEDDE